MAPSAVGIGNCLGGLWARLQNHLTQAPARPYALPMGTIRIKSELNDFTLTASDDVLARISVNIEDTMNHGGGFWMNVHLVDSDRHGLAWLGPNSDMRIEFDSEPPEGVGTKLE